MAKSEKSKAEIYREERKQRISAAAKKTAKKSRKHPKAGRIAGRVIGILLIVALICVAVYSGLKTFGKLAQWETAFTVGSHKISVAEYGYMYYMQYQNTASQAQQSEQNYGYNVYGFDYTKSPEEQDSPYTDDDGNAIKWSDQIEKNTVNYLQEFYALYDNAVAAGYTITDDELSDIDEQIESLRQSASGVNSSSGNQISMSLNAYLRANYGAGITENFMRNLMEKEMVVQRFSEDKQNEFNDKYTDEVLDKEYKEDTSAYDAVDLRMYKFEPETLEAENGESAEALQKRQDAENANALAKADALLKDVTDEASFTKAAAVYIREDEEAETAADADTKEAEQTDEQADEQADAAADEEAEKEKEKEYDSTTKSYGTKKSTLTNISEDAAKWAFDAGRKAGDKKSFAAENGTAYAIYMVKTAYPQETVDVRHILFLTMDTETQEKLSDEEIAEKKAKAEEVLAEWEGKADKTEEAFGQLADTYTEDTGSQGKGGLYEGVTPGQMVDEFDAWIFDANRKEGDVEIIESEYGFHIMYYVGNKDLAYRKTLRTSHTQDDYSSWLEAELDKDSAKVTKNPAGMQKGYDRAYKIIDVVVKNMASSSGSN